MTETCWAVVHKADNAPWATSVNLIGLTEPQARERLAELVEANVRKPHRQQYDTLEYPKGCFLRFAKEHDILIG